MQLQLKWTWGLTMVPPSVCPAWELSGGPVRIRSVFPKEAVHRWETGEYGLRKGKSPERARDGGAVIEAAMAEEERDLRNPKK